MVIGWWRQHGIDDVVCSLHKFVGMNIVTTALVGVTMVGTRRVAGARVVIDVAAVAVVVKVITIRIVNKVTVIALIISVTPGAFILIVC